jgi:N-acetylglutamate synthase-like GNAT family acetyltransferase
MTVDATLPISEKLFSFGHAEPRDVPRIARLLRQSAPETIPVEPETLREQWRSYHVVRAPGFGVVAAAAVFPIEDGRCELRSVAVDGEWRGHGLGARLVRRAMLRALAAGRQLVCVTLKPRFFERLGFFEVPLDTLPDKPERGEAIDGRRRVAMAWPRRSVFATDDAWRQG